MSQLISAPESVLLLVGREEFTPPASFGGKSCAATSDCLAVGVIDGNEAPTAATFVQTAPTTELLRLGDFQLESEGLLSLRDIYNREYAAIGTAAGVVAVTVWGNADPAPSEVVFEVAPDDLPPGE